MPGYGTWHKLLSVEHGMRRDSVRYILHIDFFKMLNYIVIFLNLKYLFREITE